MFEQNEVLTQITGLREELRFRLEAIDRRLAQLEAEVSSNSAPVAPLTNGYVPGEIAQLNPSAPIQTVEVTITPLHDVSRVRVIEAAFDAIEGVESASLQTLSGNTAHMNVRAREDVALISGLRRTLRLAFDVTESDDSSFTIALAQPRAEREGGVAAHKAS